MTPGVDEGGVMFGLILLLIAVGALAIRLIGIDQPFVDRWSWRQTGVAMIAENFYRDGFNLFCPRVNWAGSSPGYVGTEFPLVPAIAALFYGTVGVDDRVGRAVSLVFFLVSFAAFFALLRRIANPTVAFCAVASYSLVPLCVFSSRSFMPDMAALALSLAALDALVVAVDSGDLTTLYYSRRKGWNFLTSFGNAPPDSEHAIRELQQLLARGAGYLVFSRHTVWWLDHYAEFRDYLTSRYPRVRDTEDYVIFDLRLRQTAVLAAGARRRPPS
jgi:hypothetical protein